MKKCVVSPIFVLIAGTALGRGAAVALVSMDSGDVSDVPQAGTPGKAQPLMKVRHGERIDNAAGPVRYFAYGNYGATWASRSRNAMLGLLTASPP